VRTPPRRQRHRPRPTPAGQPPRAGAPAGHRHRGGLLVFAAGIRKAIGVFVLVASHQCERPDAGMARIVSCNARCASASRPAVLSTRDNASLERSSAGFMRIAASSCSRLLSNSDSAQWTSPWTRRASDGAPVTSGSMGRRSPELVDCRTKLAAR
jgi:hypothetical protein